MESEPNNTIYTAINSNVSSTGEQSATVSGSIDLLSDLDIYQFQLNQGEGITLDLDTVTTADNSPNFDSYLRVFDKTGQELAVNDDFSLDSEEFSLDSLIGFIANQTGNYYVGISSVANADYNPLNGEHSNVVQSGFTTVNYDLNLNIVEVIADEDANNTISEAIVINPEESTVNGSINPESDVDIFQVELAEGKGIKLKLNAQAIDSELDSYLRIFDSAGNELAFDDNSINNPAPDPANITTDSTIDFVPETPGTYFIGVSSAGNFDYDAIHGDTNLNFSPNTGFSTGAYELQANIIDVVPDEDPDNTLTEAIDSEVSSSGERDGLITGEINPELDVDVYQIQLDQGDGVYLDLDAKILDSQLNSLIRIFDSAGNELSLDDNDDANLLGDISTDSAIAFAPTTTGTYYIGISDAGNFDYDPVNGRTNFSSNVASPFSTVGTYELKINIEPIIADQDPDNTLTEAIDSNVSSAGETSTIINESIDSASDVDLYQFQLDAGEGITLDINAATQNSSLDSYLRLFDSEGNELAFDDDDDHNVNIENNTADSLLNFVADTSGEYYIGVSSEGNTDYDQNNGSNNFSQASGFSAGDYQLVIDISPVIDDQDPDNTISEALATGISSTGEELIVIEDEIASTADVDIYQFQLNQGNTINLDIDAAADSDLDSVLRLFDSVGNELINNDDGIAEDETSSSDSMIEFTAINSGEYYVGVSSFPNFAYDPLNGSNNFSNDFGTSSGSYDLTVMMIDN